MKVSKAITKIQKALIKDEDYRRGWEANIAMAFKDAHSIASINKKYLNKKDIHNIANTAARNFINLLIQNPSKDHE
jgi:hypothetical protein